MACSALRCPARPALFLHHRPFPCTSHLAPPRPACDCVVRMSALHPPAGAPLPPPLPDAAGGSRTPSASGSAASPATSASISPAPSSYLLGDWPASSDTEPPDAHSPRKTLSSPPRIHTSDGLDTAFNPAELDAAFGLALPSLPTASTSTTSMVATPPSDIDALDGLHLSDSFSADDQDMEQGLEWDNSDDLTDRARLLWPEMFHQLSQPRPKKTLTQLSSFSKPHPMHSSRSPSPLHAFPTQTQQSLSPPPSLARLFAPLSPHGESPRMDCIPTAGADHVPQAESSASRRPVNPTVATLRDGRRRQNSQLGLSIITAMGSFSPASGAKASLPMLSSSPKASPRASPSMGGTRTLTHATNPSIPVPRPPSRGSPTSPSLSPVPNPLGLTAWRQRRSPVPSGGKSASSTPVSTPKLHTHPTLSTAASIRPMLPSDPEQTSPTPSCPDLRRSLADVMRSPRLATIGLMDTVRASRPQSAGGGSLGRSTWWPPFRRPLTPEGTSPLNPEHPLEKKKGKRRLTLIPGKRDAPDPTPLVVGQMRFDPMRRTWLRTAQEGIEEEEDLLRSFEDVDDDDDPAWLTGRIDRAETPTPDLPDGRLERLVSDRPTMRVRVRNSGPLKSGKKPSLWALGKSLRRPASASLEPTPVSLGLTDELQQSYHEAEKAHLEHCRILGM